MQMEQALIVDPTSELHFKPPFTNDTTSYIKMTNPTDKDMWFKVRTTAPKSYCVRPNGGTIQPKMTVSVAVNLWISGLKDIAKNCDKFKIESIFAPEGKYDFTSAVWENNSKNCSTLTCIFDVPTESCQVTNADAEVTIKELQATVQQLQTKITDLNKENSALKTAVKCLQADYDTRSRGTSTTHSKEQLFISKFCVALA